MDRVRFGRALGGGARETAKALLKAAEAAAAPKPGTGSQGSRATEVRSSGEAGRAAGSPSSARRAGEAVVRTVEGTRAATAGVKRGGRRFGEAAWGPLVKQSGVLWLEFTGVFFGLFAVTAGVGAWKHRGDLLRSGAGQGPAWFAVAMLLVFGYFTVSSFARARRRGRG